MDRQPETSQPTEANRTSWQVVPPKKMLGIIEKTLMETILQETTGIVGWNEISLSRGPKPEYSQRITDSALRITNQIQAIQKATRFCEKGRPIPLIMHAGQMQIDINLLRSTPEAEWKPTLKDKILSWYRRIF